MLLDKKLFWFVFWLTISTLCFLYFCSAKIDMRRLTLSLLFIAGWFWASAQKPVIFSTKEGAIHGFDPVSYFTESQPQKGNVEITFDFNNAIWHFVSASNRELFKTNPEKYIPQFGGYCAFGMSRGYKAETQPEAWTMVDGKLYLNYNKKVREEWNKNQVDFISKASSNWVKVKDQ
jgi:YHS domain-containing protein